MNDWDTISETMFARRSYDAPLLDMMIAMRDRYHAQIVIPVNNAEEEPELPQLGPQLIHDGIENTAMRCGMTLPQIVVPAMEAGKPKGVRSEEYAAIRRRALYAEWDHSLMALLMLRAYRQLSGYGTFTAIVMPDFKYERASVELRDPLSSYPELRNPGDMRPPVNIGLIYSRSSDWIYGRYGNVFDTIGTHPEGDGLWDTVEWIDEDHIVLGILGPRLSQGWRLNFQGAHKGMELSRYPNRAGCVPVACPRRITLDTVASQMESITGAADWLDRLMALNVLAAEKNIFPDMYALGEENAEPELASGPWQDGRTGNINLLRGTKAVGQLVSTTGPMTQAVISQLERAGRMGSGNIPQYGGEAPNSVRTGRAIDTLGSYSVDPRIKELQEIASASLSRSINPAILETLKGYWPKKHFTVFSGWPGDPGHCEYTPEKHFETNENVVSYSFPGTDVSAVSVAVLQLVGGELMSRKTARIKHPMIDDADEEGQEVLVERLQAGAMASLQTQIAQGQLPAIDAAAIIKYVQAGLPIEESIIKADEDARKRQAAEAPEPGEGQVTAPEAQPGLSMPGMGAESAQPPPPSVADIPRGQQNLRDVLRAVRTR